VWSLIISFERARFYYPNNSRIVWKHRAWCRVKQLFHKCVVVTLASWKHVSKKKAAYPGFPPSVRVYPMLLSVIMSLATPTQNTLSMDSRGDQQNMHRDYGLGRYRWQKNTHHLCNIYSKGRQCLVWRGETSTVHINKPQAQRNILLTAVKWLFKHRIKGTAAVPDHVPPAKVFI
jgi:hypothetical protein